MCPLSLSVLSGGAGGDETGPLDPLWMHVPVLEMVVETEPQLLGKGQALSISEYCIHSRPG